MLHVLNSATNMGFKRFPFWLGLATLKTALSGDTVVRHLNNHDQLNFLLRTNRAVVLAVLWAALAACVVGSLVHDVADWISAW
jgi:hypothetical protein